MNLLQGLNSSPIFGGESTPILRLRLAAEIHLRQVLHALGELKDAVQFGLLNRQLPVPQLEINNAPYRLFYPPPQFGRR